MTAPTRTPKRSQVSPFVFLPALAVILTVMALGWPWYRWATAGETPYDELGIDINSYMPGPLHDWACDKIAARFPRTVPPYGCGRT